MILLSTTVLPLKYIWVILNKYTYVLPYLLAEYLQTRNYKSINIYIQ